MGKFKKGDEVRVLKQTHGWGQVREGNIGIVKSISKDTLQVDFKNHLSWRGELGCFELVENETIYNKDIQYEVY
jgi:hypothetical protein